MPNQTNITPNLTFLSKMIDIKRAINNFKNAYKQSILAINFSKKCLVLTIIFFIVCFYPSDAKFYDIKRSDKSGQFVYLTENYARFLTTIAAVVVPIYKKDIVGVAQMLNIGISTTISTHFFKRAFNSVKSANDVRLGQRPYSPKSNHNMPSGHSTMVSCEALFLIFRYGLKGANKKLFALFLLLVCAATMYARVMLDMHTISATIAGFLLGTINAMIFTSQKK